MQRLNAVIVMVSQTDMIMNLDEIEVPTEKNDKAVRGEAGNQAFFGGQ